MHTNLFIQCPIVGLNERIEDYELINKSHWFYVEKLFSIENTYRQWSHYFDVTTYISYQVDSQSCVICLK